MSVFVRMSNLAVLSCAFLAMSALTACDRLGLGGDKSSEADGDGDGRTKKASSGESDGDGASKKAEAPKPFEGKVFAVGEAAELDGLTVTVEEVKECKYEIDAYNSGLEKKGHKFVGALVVFESTAEKTIGAGRGFRAHDEDQIVFKTQGTGSTDCKPPLADSRLQTGEKAKGWVGVEVPKDVKGLTMRYEHHPNRAPGAKHNPDTQYPVFALRD